MQIKKVLTVLLLVAVVSSTLVAPVSAASLGFTPPVVTEQVGDVAYITVQFSAQADDNASIKIGSVEDDGYTLQADIVSDHLAYDEMVLAYDTTAAGNPNEKTLRVVGGKTDAKVEVTHESRLSDRPIDPTSYSMRLYVAGELSDIGELQLENADAPESIDVGRAMQTANSKQVVQTQPASTDTVAHDDFAVVLADLQGTGAYINENTTATELREGGPIHSEYGVYMTLESLQTQKNQQSQTELGLEGVNTHRTPESDTLFVTVDSSEYSEMQVGGEYRMTITVEEKNPYVPAGEYSTTFEMVERKGSFDVGSNGYVNVKSSPGQQISGQTTLAEGTQIMVIAQSEENPPLFERAKTTVGPDGDFSVSIDFSEAPDKSVVRVRFADISGSSQVAIGNVEQTNTQTPEGEERTQNPQTQTQEPTTETPTDETTTSQTDTTESTTTSTPTENNDGNVPPPPEPGQPGFTTVTAILAFLGIAVFLIRGDK